MQSPGRSQIPTRHLGWHVLLQSVGDFGHRLPSSQEQSVYALKLKGSYVRDAAAKNIEKQPYEEYRVCCGLQLGGMVWGDVGDELSLHRGDKCCLAEESELAGS